MRRRSISSTTTRRAVLAAAVVAQLLVATGAFSAAAPAFGGGPSTPTEATGTTEAAAAPSLGEAEGETQPAPQGADTGPTAGQPQTPPAPAGPEASGETSSTGTATEPPSPQASTSPQAPSGAAGAATPTPPGGTPGVAPPPAQGRGGVDGTGPIRHAAPKHRYTHWTPAPARTPASPRPPAPAPEHSEGEAPAISVEGLSSPLPNLSGLTADSPPGYLLPIYREAGARYHVPWSILAAINQIETNYGRDLSVSSAGAAGWMQFMPATWREWGVDADGDGIKNPYSPRDAIFAAARYLHASGGSRDLAQAIFAYNHAAWYVTEVIVRARSLAAESAPVPLQHGYSLPLDRRYMTELGRTDDGVDIETPPDGALVYSMTPGIVTAVASDPGGFGPDYPVVEATSGALAGSHVYYGHVAQALVHAGEHVTAGQPIAVIGHTGDAIGLGHGHIEIGFSDASGTPVNQHGAAAATPAGAVMRSFLIELSAAFGVKNS